MAISPSLFDAPAHSVISASTDWMSQAISGTIATTLCVIAVAIIGMLLMTGRLPFRDALRTLIGCFVLLGAPTIALGLRDAASSVPQATATDSGSFSDQTAPPPLPAANFDPYAGASLQTQ